MTSHRDQSPVSVMIGDLQVSAAVAQDTGPRALDLYQRTRSMPPATICGDLSGQKLTADVCGVPHVRGSGLGWPLSARIAEGAGSARFPAALAWALCDHKERDRWRWCSQRGRTQSINSVDAIAEIVRTVLARHGVLNDNRLVTVVVPNTLGPEAQDDLLRALAARGIRPHLLWRPIAAALAWVDEFAPVILGAPGQGTRINDAPLGLLWVIHLGLDAFEVAQLELIRWQHGETELLLPARRLPTLPSLYGLGLAWAEQIAEQSQTAADNVAGAAWNLLWTSDWLNQVVAQPDGREKRGFPAAVDVPYGQDAIDCGVKAARALLDGLANMKSGTSTPAVTCVRRSFAPLDGPFAQERLGRSGSQVAFMEWIAELRRLARTDLPILGLVGTGTFANMHYGNETLCRLISRLLGNPDQAKNVILDSAGTVLSHGAAIHAQRLQSSLPSYLDVLPMLELLVVRAGEPAFEDILCVDAPYVLGGREMTFAPPDLGLHVQREERSLTLSVWREGHDFVRDVNVEFPNAIPNDMPVSLLVKMTPGQGNPRIEVKPAVAHVFGGRRVYLNWARAHDTGRTREEELANVPRTNPPLEPRRASLAAWRGGYWTTHGGARQAVRAYLAEDTKIAARGWVARLNKVREHLWRTDPAERNKQPPNHCTSVSSDGCLHESAHDQDLLSAFVSQLDGALAAQGHEDLKAEMIRTLGYCSAKSRHLLALLRRVLQSPESIRDYHLVAFGNCLREPRDVQQFVKATCHCIREGRLPERTEWLKALARILQYRDEAAKLLSDDECYVVSRFCLRAMEEQIEDGNAAYVYRNASLCIVYLLRRRKYQPAYLGPDDALTRETKRVFRLAIQRYKAHKLRVIGGIVDLPTVTQMMIDYVDRKGRGRLVGFALSE